MNKHSEDILKTLQSMAERDQLTGCFADIPVEVYHHKNCPGVSSSQLKGILKKSYNHFQIEKTKDAAPLKFGSAFHSFVNEPEDFVNTYQIIYGKDREILTPGMLPLSSDDMKTIQIMEKKLMLHPDAGPLLKGAQNELSYFSLDERTGILKKCRVDAIKDMKISDLKTTKDASPEQFARDSRKYLTRVSAAYYTEIVSEILGVHLNEFYLIACEHTEPHEINVFKVAEKSIETGREEVRKALDLIKSIHENGSLAWTGYDLGIKDIYI